MTIYVDSIIDSVKNKSECCDIKCHMTLNIIFNVVTSDLLVII